ITSTPCSPGSSITAWPSKREARQVPMLEFMHPGFLIAGSALVSLPIVIHLINRMRYRRVRWAAMEFLLKSQKRNRRRLIIEQLLLLALRCLLVMLGVLLVSRYLFAFFQP